MLICGHCGGLVKSLSDLAVHLRCEEKPQELVVVENTSDNSRVMPCRYHDVGEPCRLEMLSFKCGIDPCTITARA